MSQARYRRLLAAGASLGEADEILTYCENRFVVPDPLPELPLPDEACFSAWTEYRQATRQAGGIRPLFSRLVQLSFLVEAGMSCNPDYLAATRRGVLPSRPVGIALKSPERCRIELHDSYAGGIGVLFAEERCDFEALIQALTARNEPVEVRPSMGAMMIAGYNNWDRIHAMRKAFLLAGGTDGGWSSEFSRIKALRELYQDRFIVLSSGPYSGVPWEVTGLSREDWMARSKAIRLEHEYTHYFTRRVFGSMQNNLLDEMMADYAGLRAAFGSFCARWMLLFFGLESPTEYREGGRLQNYRGNPQLSAGAFRILARLVRDAAVNLERFDRAISSIDAAPPTLPTALVAIATMTIDGLAAPEAPEILAERYRSAGWIDRNRAASPNKESACEKLSTY